MFPPIVRLPQMFLGLFMMLTIGGVMGGVIGGIYGSTNSSSDDTSDNVTSDTTLNTDVESVMSNFLPADCTLTNTSTPRIINGNIVQSTSVPYIVTLFITRKRKSFLCGGSIINNYWIVTAAHCLINADEDIIVVAGNSDLNNPDTGEVRTKSAKTFTHSDYGPNVKNDISLIKLSSPLTYTDRIAPVCLGRTKLSPINKVIVAGWGIIQAGDDVASNELRSVEINTRTDATCNIRSSETSLKLCAGDPDENQDCCRGDSGGPLARREDGKWTLYGVTSYGFDKKCNGYGVYTNIPNYVNWIQDIVRKN